METFSPKAVPVYSDDEATYETVDKCSYNLNLSCSLFFNAKSKAVETRAHIYTNPGFSWRGDSVRMHKNGQWQHNAGLSFALYQ